MKKYVLLLLNFSFFSLCLFSQSDNDQGYVVLVNGDTLQGKINYRAASKNPYRFTFQSQEGGAETVFQPGEVKSFFSNDNYYISAKVEKEVSPTKVDQLEKRKTLILEEVTVFLRALIVGKKSLYYYQDDNGHENFYIYENDQFVLLEYKRYAKQEDGRSVIGEIKKYSGQLALYLSDCPEIAPILQSTEYRKSSLQKAFLKYYECGAIEMDFQQKTGKATVDLGVLTGVSVSSLSAFSSSVPELSLVDYETSTDFVAGLFMEIILSRKLKQFSFPFELVYTSFSIQGRHTDVEGEFPFDYRNFDFEYAYLKVNNLIRYNVPIGKASLFFNAGMSNGIVLKRDSSIRSYIVVNGALEQTERLDEFFTRNFEQGFLVGVGASISSFSLELRAERANGISATKAFGLATNRYFGLLSYRF